MYSSLTHVYHSWVFCLFVCLFACLFVCLFCFVLFCFVLFCFALFCFVLFCFVLFCFVLFCFVLFCFVLFCFVLFCFVLFSFLLFSFALFLFCFCLFVLKLLVHCRNLFSGGGGSVTNDISFHARVGRFIPFCIRGVWSLLYLWSVAIAVISFWLHLVVLVSSCFSCPRIFRDSRFPRAPLFVCREQNSR